ncbi:MAG: efflux RND transporter permease subunit [Calditrichaeota bacterium]|nr:MAG: efflux RND transporter permease subunit [Calditrichota bacterium]
MKDSSFFPRLAVKRPVTIVVTLMAILVVGTIAYIQIPIELLPSGYSPPYLGVWIPYRNANPREVEEQIARPVEEQIRTIPGITRVTTYSHGDGCWAWMEFAAGTDMDLAYDQLRDRMERARAILPDDLDRYYLRKFGRNDAPIIFLSVNFPPEVDDPYHYVEQYIKRPIERLDGVANVEIWGADEKAIQILIDQDRVKAYNINLYQVITDLRRDNFALSSGWVYEGEKKFVIRSVARFQNLDDLRNLPINAYGLRLKDIAEVKYEVPQRTWRQRINGRPGLLMGIYKESLANTVALSHKLETLLNQEILQHPALKNAEVNLLFVQGQMIEDSIDNLIDTALWGGLFAILILLFFLRNIRMTLIMLFAIPLSVLISLMVIYFIGWTLNLIVMMGLMISVGMVVDNGIVVLENIYHKRSDGLPPRKASVVGASEVNLAIIMATLTTITVFIPMLLIDDGSGQFKFYMQRVGLPVIFALLGSLFVALVLIPLATAYLAGAKMAPEHALIRRSKAFYQRLLARALHRRIDMVMIVLLILGGTFWLMGSVSQVDQQEGNISDIRLIFELPDNFTTEQAEEFFAEVEDTIFAHAREYDVKSIDVGFRRGFGRVRIYLNPPPKEQWYHAVYHAVAGWLGIKTTDKMKREEVLADLKERLPLKPGVEFRTSWRGASTGGDEGVVSLMLYGDDTEKLAELAEEVERRLRLIEGVISVETDREAGGDEIQISLDRDVVSRNGITPNQVASTLMYAVRGISLPRFQASDREIQMRIQLREEDRENLQQLKNITFMNNRGRPIPLSAIATFQITKGFGQIARENGKTFLAVKAHTPVEDLGRISAQIDALMKNFPLPVGYRWEKGTRFRRLQQQGESFRNALLLAVLFVYLLMAVLFESMVLPLSIMFTIPLSLFGAFLALYITGTPQDIMTGIGIVILVGVVVNNGIVLVDMINRRRWEGMSRTEAILDAGKNRFRPIIMTSFTTIGGLIPMALGTANLFGMPYAPMGRAIIGGMLTSTFLTLLVVPVFYTLFDDFGLLMQRIVGWFRRQPATGAMSVGEEG